MKRIPPEDSLLSHFLALNPQGPGPSCIQSVPARIETKGAGRGCVQGCRTQSQHLTFAPVSPRSPPSYIPEHSCIDPWHHQLAGFPPLPPGAGGQHLLCPSTYSILVLLRRGGSSDLPTKKKRGDRGQKPLPGMGTLACVTPAQASQLWKELEPLPRKGSSQETREMLSTRPCLSARSPLPGVVGVQQTHRKLLPPGILTPSCKMKLGKYCHPTSLYPLFPLRPISVPWLQELRA